MEQIENNDPLTCVIAHVRPSGRPQSHTAVRWELSQNIFMKLNLLDKFLIFTRGFHSGLALIMFIPGILIMPYTLVNIDLYNLKFIINKTDNTTGRIVKIHDQPQYVNYEKLITYDYQYSIKSNSFSSSLTSSKYGLKTNDSLKVEYIKSKPSDSRIKDLADYNNQYYVFLFSLILLIIGGIFLVNELKRSKEIIFILTNYTCHQAHKTNRKEEILFGGAEDADSYKIYFKYTINDIPYYVLHKTFKLDKLKDNEPIVYSTVSPSIAVLTKELPKHLQERTTPNN